MKWIECSDCGEEFRIICDSDIKPQYCPYCGENLLDSEDFEDEYFEE